MTKIEDVDFVYNELIKHTDDEKAEEICQYIYDDKLMLLLIMEFNNNNIKTLEILLSIFKKNDYIRDIIHDNMIKILLVSLHNEDIFYHACLWFDEFGCNTTIINNNYLIVLYNKSLKCSKSKPYINKLLKDINSNNKTDIMNSYFIADDVDIILPFISNSSNKLTKNKNKNNVKNNTNEYSVKEMMILCYQYDAINTLKKIQEKQKYVFFEIQWYLLSPCAFTKVMKMSNRDPYSNEKFAYDWIRHICGLVRWDYLPTMINNMTPNMWRVLAKYFYMGRLSLEFVVVLIHQMNKHNIPLKTLHLDNIIFNDTSTYTNYLKNNNYYNLFSIENNKYANTVVPIPDLDHDIYDSSFTSVVHMLTIFQNNSIHDLVVIIYDAILQTSNKLVNEFEYIETLIDKDELGWNKDMLHVYTTFKKTINTILEQANLSNQLLLKYYSYCAMHEYNFLPGYKLRYINDIINTFRNIKLSIYINECQMIYNNAAKIKSCLLYIIRYQINCKQDPNEFYVLPKKASIYDYFQNIIENCDEYNYEMQKYNDKYIALLKDNTKIQNIVRRMLYEFLVPLQCVRPIVYNYYNLYTKEEQFFLE